MAELQLIIVVHGRHIVRHLEICNPICVKLTLIDCVRYYYVQLKKKRRHYLKPFSHGPQMRHTHTQTDTHDDSIRRNAIRCISPKNPVL